MDSMKNMNLMKLMSAFDTKEECIEALEGLRWPHGVRCPDCDSEDVTPIKNRYQYNCISCRYHFSVTSGTIFHDSHLPLPRWFAAVYLMCEAKKGISANQLKRTLGIGSYKTAWYLCHRIRNAMREATPEKLDGIVEVDETYIGGKKTNVGHGFRGNKTIIVGAIQRGGDVRMKVIKRNDRKTLHNFIREYTKPETEMIITDEWPAYLGIKDHDTDHQTVNPRLKEWVREHIHTNTIENVWSILNRSIIGAYHKVSAKHLDAYIDELEWRFNNRKNPFLFRDILKQLITAPKMEYQKLIAS